MNFLQFISFFVVCVAFVSCTITITPVTDPQAPTENSVQYIVTANGRGFIVDTGKFKNEANNTISKFKELLPNQTPAFVFITHGHPDHCGGVAYFRIEWPGIPIIVGSPGVANECSQWVAFVCNVYKIFEPEQCLFDYVQLMNISVSGLDNLGEGSNTIVTILGNYLQDETTYSNNLLIDTPNNFYLFSGDNLNIKSHLYASNYFFSQAGFPQRDDDLCNWAGDLQTLKCQFSNKKSLTIYPGHGPDSYNYELQTGKTWKDAIDESISWLKTFRKLSFTSCNATYVWEQMQKAFPTFGMNVYSAIGGIGTHIPADAAQLGCNCTLTDSCPDNEKQIPYCAMIEMSGTVPKGCATSGAGSSSSDSDNKNKVPIWAVIVGVVGAALVCIVVGFRMGRKSSPSDDHYTKT